MQVPGSNPAVQVAAAPPCLGRRGAQPVCRDPVDLRLLDPLQVGPQLPERRGDVPIDDGPVEQVAELGLHDLGLVDHVLEVLLLRIGERLDEQKAEM